MHGNDDQILPIDATSPMQVPSRRDARYETLRSSSELGWSTVLAELRAYLRGEGTPPASAQAQIAILLGGSDKGTTGYRIGGHWSYVRPAPGLIWLKPMGGKYDEAYLTANSVPVLSLNLASSVFAQLSDDYRLPAAPERSIRFECGAQDEVINQIGLCVLSEMMSPSAAGRMLAETASLLLAARLMHAHLDAGPIRLPTEPGQRLDDRRLRRVLDYVEEHLLDDMTVADLASVACLSIFHFTRAFSSTMGVPPYRYLSQRRLERAKAMITAGRTSIIETALVCQFSSQSSFTRAFRRATGMTPAQYRQAVR